VTPAQLVATAAAVVPGLDGCVVPPASAGAPWHATTPDSLVPLRQGLAGRHPEAGPPYWALRGWGLLVWQPIYLGVIAAHLGDGCPQLDRVSQPLRSGDVDGFCLGEHTLEQADEPARIQTIAAALAAGCEALLRAWCQVAPLHPKAARRTCADCALAALLAVHCQGRLWQPDEVVERGEGWLRAMGLAGESGYMSYRLHSGEEALALDRQVCCLHFRRQGAERCATCPKRPVAERIACLSN
jgi:siderophore ferric iron reductase